MAKSSASTPQLPPEFMRLPQVMAWTGLARSTLYRMVADESFPRPVKLSSRTVGWRRCDLEAWGEKRH